MKTSTRLDNPIPLLVAAALAIATAACGGDNNKIAPDAAPADAPAADAPVQTTMATLKLATSATLGSYLTDGNGNTLYLYSKDFPANAAATTPAVSNCSGGCLAAWPVFHADTVAPGPGLNAADFGELTRADGTKQTTFHGWPLYYFANDKQAGDTKGDKVGNVWFVLREPFYAMLVMAAPTAGSGPPLYLSTPDGMTLYYFTPDVVGTATTPPVSNCTAGCLATWPAFLATGTVLPTGVAAALTTFDRGGGAQQSAWKGHPLYLFANDKKPSDTKGDKLGNMWFVIDPTMLQ